MEASINIDEAALLAGVGRVIGSFTPSTPGPFQDAMGEALGYLMDEQQSFFMQESEEMGMGEIWPDLAIFTKKHRAIQAGVKYFPGIRFPILYETGKLYNSLAQRNPGNLLTFTEESATQATSISYAAQHQLGNFGHPPQRQFIFPPTAEQLDMAKSIITGGMILAVQQLSF